ncbi:hypothetical protein CQW23_04005 [Capsicum baccatum]|uniref:Zinc finger BED domain-containing protein RICESLEEPER 2-like n=1 Tax=Capsicum baccatum TaxID=33114 RepID=A0A2G2XDJ7_CAPBA|nr:hypothetical protein CQW23_04005 [Capsicum baccatum]
MKKAIDDVEDLEAQPQVEETPTALAPYATQEHGCVSNITSILNPPKKQKRIALCLRDSSLGDHKGETIASAIKSCLLDWEIKNLFTVTFDNASANDVAITHLKQKIGDWKGVIMRNNFLHVRCNAHILNLIVKDGLSEQNESISRVRNIVKYVKSSSVIAASFKSYVEKVKLDTNGLLSLDVETR